MKKRLKYFLLFLIATLILIFFTANSVNDWFKKVSSEEIARKNLPLASANSIKHAYAAGLLYESLRSFSIGPDTSAGIVIFLGKANEAAERVLKLSANRDTTLEMIKDLHNNQIGVNCARFAEQNQQHDLLNLIGTATQNHVIYQIATDAELDAGEKESALKTADPFAAYHWLDENSERLMHKSCTNPPSPN